MTHFADRLAGAVRAKGNVGCVGLDPRWEMLPAGLRHRFGDGTVAGVASAYRAFCTRVVEIVAPLVPAVKPQAAFFEACGPEGMAALRDVLRHARERGLITVLDGKRNDIASTAEAYADAAFDGPTFDGIRRPVWQADSLTVNPYLGRDAIEPFLKSARRTGRGLFVLVRTSNAGAGLFQDLDCDGRPVFEHVAGAVAAWNAENLGACGYGDVGAVVGATHPAELSRLRERFPGVWFLVPGYGAQGGTVADVRPAIGPDGLGALVNSSRGATFPFPPDDPDWEGAIDGAVRHMASELAVG